MSVLAGATPSDGSLISGIYDDELAFAFASQEEIDSEIQDSTLSCTSKRDRDEAFGKQDETELQKKFKRTGTWVRIDSIEETEDLVSISQVDKKYEYDPALRPYTAVYHNNQYSFSVDKGRESNRVFRTVPANRFLILTLPEIKTMREILNILKKDIVHTFPETGIKKRFTFLSSSDSRIRVKDRKTVLFFEEGPDYTARSLLQKFGDLDAILLKSGIGKYFARLSLNFSTTIPTIDIDRFQVATIPDLQAPDGKDFTDGCGCITRSAARRVAKALGLQYVPSVFQFRYAGAKGVLVPHEPEDLERWFPGHYEPGIELYLRPSQIKYDAWQYTSLDISDHSKQRTVFKCAKLQRAMIRILTDQGVPLRNFKMLLRKELEHLVGVLKDRQKASDWLKRQETSLDADDKSPQAMCLRMIAAGHDLSEPYLAQMLGRMLAKDILQLRRKLHIPVTNSIYLFGVCDESGALQEDEIYCHAGTDGFIEGKVLMTRSPMMHPGDVRVVTAVKPPEDSPFYRHSDCVVLPIRGYQPLADKMGGGDLDGDQYFISWNEAIIPETVDPPNPREVSPPSTPLEAKVKKEKSARPAKTYDHMEELRRYIGKRVLSFDIGATAKAWTEAANARELGSRDPYCLALSARYECCLDTNKTGEEIPPIPPDALKGPLRTGPCPFEQLDLIIRQETLGLACPWTFGQGDRTSEMQQQRFRPDPDLMFLQSTPEWRKAYADVCRLLGEYWKEFHKNLKKMEGPNKPLVKLEREPVDIVSQPAITAKDLAREVFQEEMDRYLESQRATLFKPDEKAAEFNRENTIIASACYSAVYNRMSNGLATPIEMAWWGEPWLNSLKARESSLDSAAA